jgi:D-glycero-D-manno-heptose 1,7-bisphosphate phosphatase
VARAVFLDRDGVINKAIVRDGKPYPPRNLAELELVPGIAAALATLKDFGFRLLVVTNQPDVARGVQQQAVVEEINDYLLQNLPLDQIYTCYHDDIDNCQCRKPLAGLVLQGAQAWQVELDQSFLIGDRWKDIACGQNAGCVTIFIDMKYSEPEKAQPHYRVSSIQQAVEIIRGLIVKEAV